MSCETLYLYQYAGKVNDTNLWKSLRCHLMYRFGISSNKLMDYMMVGKPVLHFVAAGNDPVIEVVAAHDCTNDLTAIAKAGRGPKGEVSIRVKRTCEYWPINS